MIGPPSRYFLVRQFAVEARTVGIETIIKQRANEELWTEKATTNEDNRPDDEMSTQTPRVEVSRPPIHHYVL